MSRVLERCRDLARDSLLRNSAYIMASTVVGSSLGYVYWLIAARAYSPAQVGLGAALISATMLTSVLANLGGGSVLVQLLPERCDPVQWSRVLTAAVVLGVGLSLVGGAAMVGLLGLLSGRLGLVVSSLPIGMASAGAVACWTLATLTDLTFVAERAAGMMLVRNALFSVAKIVMLVLPLLVWSPRAIGILGSSALAAGVSAVGALWILVPRLKPGARPVISGLRRQAREMRASLAGHHAINLGGLLPMYLLPVIVAARLSVTDNAYFYVSWMMGGLFFMVSPAVASALFAEGAHDRTSIHRGTRSAAIIIAALLAVPMGTFLVGARWVLSFFGPSYPSHGAALITVLVISAVPDAITNIAVSVFRVQGRLRQAAALNIGMAGFVLVFSWVLLPRLGIVAVGWAWLLAQTLGSLVVASISVWPRRRRQREAQEWLPAVVEP